MHRSTLPAAFTLSMSTRDLRAGTYHGVLVSLGNVLHFVTDGECSGRFRRRMIALSELCCGFV